jgi:hypothetical protein
MLKMNLMIPKVIRFVTKKDTLFQRVSNTNRAPGEAGLSQSCPLHHHSHTDTFLALYPPPNPTTLAKIAIVVSLSERDLCHLIKV